MAIDWSAAGEAVSWIIEIHLMETCQAGIDRSRTRPGQSTFSLGPSGRGLPFRRLFGDPPSLPRVPRLAATALPLITSALQARAKTPHEFPSTIRKPASSVTTGSFARPQTRRATTMAVAEALDSGPWTTWRATVAALTWRRTASASAPVFEQPRPASTSSADTSVRLPAGRLLASIQAGSVSGTWRLPGRLSANFRLQPVSATGSDLGEATCRAAAALRLSCMLHAR